MLAGQAGSVFILGAGVAAAAFYCGRAYAAQQLAAKDKTGDESIEYPTRGPSDFSFRGEVPVGAESSRGAESSSTIPSLAVTAAVDALADAEAKAWILENLCRIGPLDLGGLIDMVEVSLRSFGRGEVQNTRVLLISDRTPNEFLFRQEGSEGSAGRRQGRRSMCSMQSNDSSTPNVSSSGNGPSPPGMGSARASFVMRGGSVQAAEVTANPATAFTKAVSGPGQWMTCSHGRSLGGAAVASNSVKRAGKFMAKDCGYDPVVDGVPRIARPPSRMEGFKAYCYDVVAVPFSLPDGTVAGAFVIAGLNSHDAEESVFSEAFVERAQWLGAVAASQLTSGVRYTSCRMALDMVLRPQMAGKNTMEAEIDEGSNDEDTKKYLLNTFTASAIGTAALSNVHNQTRRRDSRVPSHQATSLAPTEEVSPAEEADQLPVMDAPDDAALAALDAKLATLKPTLDNWDVDPYEYYPAQLGEMFKAMLHSLGLINRFCIPVAALDNFWTKVCESYNDVPFHNMRHAWSVSHRGWLFLERSDLRNDILTDLEVLALMFAAICHDLDHPGQNNAFQVNSLNNLALLYNDMSVLENHHSSVAFSIVTKDECAILKNLTTQEFKAFRLLVVNAILATDMSNHKKLVNKISALSAGGRGGIDRNSPDDRQLLVSFLLHCADLSNPLSSFDSSKKVSDRVSVEFNTQAELERKKGLPVTVMESTDGASKAKMEIGFIDYVVLPLYELLVAIAPSLSATIDLIYESRASWEESYATESVAAAMDGLR